MTPTQAAMTGWIFPDSAYPAAGDDVALLRSRERRTRHRHRDVVRLTWAETPIECADASFGNARTRAASTSAACAGTCRSTSGVGSASRRAAASGATATPASGTTATPARVATTASGATASGTTATPASVATTTASIAAATASIATTTGVATAATGVAATPASGATATASVATTAASVATTTASVATTTASIATTTASVATTTASIAAAATAGVATPTTGVAAASAGVAATTASIAAAPTTGVAAATTGVAAATTGVAATATAGVATPTTGVAAASAGVAAPTATTMAAAASAGTTSGGTTPAGTTSAGTTPAGTTSATAGVRRATDECEAGWSDRQRRRRQNSGRESRDQTAHHRAAVMAGVRIDICMDSGRHDSPHEKLLDDNVRFTIRFSRTPPTHDGLHQKFAQGTICTPMPSRAPASALPLFGLLVLLAGCGSKPPADLAGLPAAPVPDYGIGDSYRFSDGAIENVIAIDRDTVRWRGTSGNYVTSHDVLLPRIAWSDATAQGERRIGAAAPLLFPLVPGKSVVFSATRTVRPMTGGTPVTVRENWRCDVPGTARVETPAGAFNTWRVDCSMTEQSGAPGSSVVQRSLYYAPDIGFYVRREERTGADPVQQVELIDYTSAEPSLPDSALRLRIVRIQQALEHEMSGDATSWHDPRTGDGGDVLPVRTVQSGQYGWCRDFAEHIRAAGRAYNLAGTGCRNASGIWDIIELGPARNGSG
jgi:hypothetical protein